MVQYKVRRQEWCALFYTSKAASQVLVINLNAKVLKERLAQTLANYNSTQKCRAKDKSFQSLEYECLVSRYSKKSEE